ncbi:6813_t:CDS:2, partial [Cetraspora pellucida]
METPLKLLAADHLSIDLLYLNTNEQQDLKNVLTLLKPIEAAMKLLSASSYPTIGDIRLQKIEEYWTIMDKPSVVSAVLDLHTKFKIFGKEEAVKSLIKTTRKFFWKWHNKSDVTESLVPNYTNGNSLEESAINNELDCYITMEIIEDDTIL